MTAEATSISAPSYACHVFPASAMTVGAGVNTGDPLSAPDEICLGDVYELADSARTVRLSVNDATAEAAGTGPFLGRETGRATVALGSEAGEPGALLALEARVTLMAPDGGRTELLLITIPGKGEGSLRYFLPLEPLEPGVEYTLIDVAHDPGAVQLANVVSVAFTRGTRITLADGTQRPVEEIHPGDPVLTRDHGPQPVRHVLSRTVRAVGAFAPVAIANGALGNADDLVVSQDQRLFLYQRGESRLADRAELLVRALDLVDGERVTLRKGGYADYVSLVFDRHEVIYAECIPVESLLVNESTRRQLPAEDRQALDASLPDLSQAPVRAAEAPSAALKKARAWIFKSSRSR